MKYLLDNGAYTLKFGEANTSPSQSFNCISTIKRELQIAPKTLINTTEILRPFDRGILVDPELQLKIWKTCLPTSISSLVYTSPIYTPPTSRHALDELIYEDLQIQSSARVTTGRTNSCLLVDLSFSCITITPIFNRFPMNYAATRCNIGGKLMTNYMKEQISYRYFDMTEETWLVNHIREKTSKVSLNFLKDLRDIQHKRVKETLYALPDGNDSGFVVSDGVDVGSRQVMSLSNLVLTVPELLFSPSDAGIECGGVHEGILESVNRLPKELGDELLKNIWICGGLAAIEGVQERILKEVRQCVDCEVRVFKAENEIFDCWESLKNVDFFVSKKDYEEMGSFYMDTLFHYS